MSQTSSAENASAFSRLGRLHGSRLGRAESKQLLPRDPLRDELQVAVGDERDLLDLPFVVQPLGEGGELPRILERRAAGVDDARQQELVEALRDVREMRPVEVDPDRIDRQLAEALLERLTGVAESQLQGELRPARKCGEWVFELAWRSVFRRAEEGLGQHDEVGVDRIQRRLENVL